jgi:putative sterol carrier protein
MSEPSEAQGNGAPDLSALDVDQVVALVGQASDEQIAEGINGEARGQILSEVFRRMCEEYKPGPNPQEAVIHWKITGPDDQPDHWEVVLEGGSCTATDQPSRDPRLTVTTDGVSFLRLVTGNAAGPMLFMSGKLKIEGDVAFAAMMQSMFRIPTAPGSSAAPGTPPGPPPAP